MLWYNIYVNQDTHGKTQDQLQIWGNLDKQYRVFWKLTTKFWSPVIKSSLMLDRLKSLLYFGGKRFCNLSFYNSEDRVLSVFDVEKRQWYTAIPTPHDCLDMQLSWTYSILKIVSWKSFLLCFYWSSYNSNQHFYPNGSWKFHLEVIQVSI